MEELFLLEQKLRERNLRWIRYRMIYPDKDLPGKSPHLASPEERGGGTAGVSIYSKMPALKREKRAGRKASLKALSIEMPEDSFLMNAENFCGP